MKFAKVMFLHLSVSHSVGGGCAWLQGGVHGCRGCVWLQGGHVWLWGGACMVGAVCGDRVGGCVGYDEIRSMSG